MNRRGSLFTGRARATILAKAEGETAGDVLRHVPLDGFQGYGRSRLTCRYDHMATLAWASTLRRLSQGCCVGSRELISRWQTKPVYAGP